MKRRTIVSDSTNREGESAENHGSIKSETPALSCVLHVSPLRGIFALLSNQG